MPSTYTLNNGIELIGTGEQSGTWGDTTNTNFELIDTALDGQVTVTLASAGTSGAPNTLPISDGSSSNGRNRMVIFNDGADLGATAYVQLTPNDAEKIVYIRNALSGSRSIIVFQGTYSASNDYEIPAGTTAVIYFNGGGAGAVAANVFNNAYFDSLRLGGVSVTAILDEDNMASDSATALATQQSIKAYVDAQVGANNELSEVLANGNTTGGTDIVVSSGDQITTNTISETTAATGVTIDGVLLKDNGITATGGGSLTGTWSNLGSVTTVDINGGTIDGVTIGGSSAGAITGTTITGSSATISGDLTVDTNTLHVDSANNRVGVGTTSPASALDVTGTVTADGLTVDGATSVNGANINVDNGYGYTWGSNAVQIYSDGNYMRFRTLSTDRIQINNNGDITFYDTSGNASFVYDESAGSVFNEQGADRDFRVESDTNTHMLFVDAGNNRVGINAGATPSSIFHILDSASVNSIVQSTGVNSEACHSYINDAYQWRSGIFGTDDYRIVDVTNSESRLAIRAGSEMVVNEDSKDRDFRVESDANTHMLFVDAGNNTVQIGTADNVTAGAFPAPNLFLKAKADGAFTLALFQNNTDTSILGLGYDTTNSRFIFNSSYRAGADYRDVAFGRQGTTDSVLTVAIAGSETVVNDGSYDLDFRVESDTNTHALFVDAGNSRVGINNSSPTEALDVTGNVTISGSLSKGSGSFKIDHPVKPDTHHLVHSFVEAPQADNIYRGKVGLIAGQATVNIDTVAGMTEGTFVLLNREVQCFTSNESGWTAVRGKVDGNILTIEAQDPACTDTISWMVVGERQDQHMHDTDWTDENGKVIVEPLKS